MPNQNRSAHDKTVKEGSGYIKMKLSQITLR